MEGTPAIYLGRIVDKKNFRAFIYGPNGEQRLAESWEEFEANMQSGVWFATKEDAEASKVPANDPIQNDEPLLNKKKSKPRAKLKSKPKVTLDQVEEIDDAESVLPDDDSVFEVTDDFLSKENE